MATAEAKDLTFLWEGTDRRGRRMKGETIAISEAAARTVLRGQGIAVVRMRKKSTLFGSPGKAIKAGDVAVFTRQLATMLEAGVPLVQSLDIIGRGDANPRMQKLVLAVKSDVESGLSLTESLAKHPKHFDALFINLVEAGEQAGALESLLDKVATYKEKTEALKSKIKKALFYPSAVMMVAVVVTGILLVFVVPQFQELFRGFGADLPGFTQMVINLSEWLQGNLFLILLGAIGIVVGFAQAHQRSAKFRFAVDRYMLKMPIFGDILVKAAIARYARTLATMFSAGVPLVEALSSVAGATGNLVYEKAVNEMREQVATGQPLNLCMQQTNLFTNLAVQMIAIGEESGALDDMASKIADFYEQEVDDAVDALSSLLEPMIMVIIGVLVGGLIVAMYLPIFKLGAVVG